MLVEKQPKNNEYFLRAKSVEKPASITLSEYSRSYTGGVKKPKVIVKNGKLALNEGDYFIFYKVNFRYPGKHTITVKSQGNYSASRTITYTINKGVKVLAFTQKTIQKKHGDKQYN